jgi:hypothetical protein
MNIPPNRMTGLAAAQGITARLTRSWFPGLPRDPRVLVPVALEVLMVRTPGGAWAKCGMNVPATDPGQVVEVKDLLPPPFSQLDKTRDKGAYLHWALPDALSAGTQDGTSTTFPAIPDRWLVVRIQPHTALRRTIRGWVLKAGDAVATAVDLDSWVEPGTPANTKKPLTALGHGDVAWAAYYDNVVNRMGFHDDLSDVTAGPISYLVCGWYSDTSLDPLGDPGIHSLADFDAKMQQLQWSLADKDFHQAAKKAVDYTSTMATFGLSTTLSASARFRATLPFSERPFVKSEPGSTPAGPPYVTDGSWWPQASVYHGSVLGIGWPGIGWPGNDQGVLSGEDGGAPPAGSVKVAVGNTMAEALACLVTNANNSTKEGRILEAFQQGMLSELDEADGLARLDAILQTSAFGSIPGGTTTERTWQPESGPPPVGPASPAAPAPGVFERYQHASAGLLRKSAQATLRTTKAGPVNAQAFQANSYMQETVIAQGDLSSVLFMVDPTDVEPYVPGKWIDTQRSLPRFFHPTDPVVLLQGLRWAFKYGSAGRFSADGTLQCRLTGTCLHQYSKVTGDIVWPAISPKDILDRGVDNGSVPPECEELLGEAAILDPGASAPMVDNVIQNLNLTPVARAAYIKNVMVDQTAWYAARDPRVDSGALITRTRFTGMLPSPVSVGLPKTPWSPVHLEWLVEYTPSAGGVNDWQLGETDFTESVPVLPPAKGAPGVLQFSGRSPLHDGASASAAMAARTALDQIQRTSGASQLPANYTEQFASSLAQVLITNISAVNVNPKNVPDSDRALLEDIATTLDSMDVLSASFNTLHLQLRCGFPSDGTSAPAAGAPLPSPFFAFRAGFLRILRLRLVDCFGQFIDLAGSSATAPAVPANILRSDPLNIPTRPELLALPPRFTSPSRIWLRYLDAAGSGADATLATDVAPALSPVCGYLMPNHLDAVLEFFGSDGTNLGIVRPADDGSILWEDAPGQPSTVGQSPARAIPNQFLASVGESLIRWGINDAGVVNETDTALQALMRVIDSTLWTVDPFGHTGDEHMSLLVGHPIAVMRALLRFDLTEPVDATHANQIKVPLRLGALAHWQDGLLGYFVNDDYNTLYVSDAAVANLARAVGPSQGFLQQANLVQPYYNAFNASGSNTPVTHPYIDTTGTIWVYPNQEVNFTLLVEPMTSVNATTGLLPRKGIGMRRDWVTDALAKIAPTFRFGPVLVDPKSIRMPIAAELNGTWTWDHRTDVSTWVNDEVTHANQNALLSPDPPIASEGWLQLNPPVPGAKA